MRKLLEFFIILALFSSTAAAAEINGSIVSDGKKIAGLPVELSKINGTTQSDQSMTDVVYDFIKLSETTTDKNGSYAFNDLNSGMYRINVTYNGTVYGENTGLKDRAIVNFNLSGRIEGSVLKSNNTLEGIPIRLLDAGGIEVMDTTTGKSGKYLFNKVNAGKSYFIEATYADVPYTKQVNVSESANFTVYDSTKDDSIIAVKIDHMVLSKAPTGIKVDEYIEFTNIGDKVFFSKDRTWLGISTPPGISRFQTDVMECCLQREKDSAWIDPMRPIMPGESYSAQISYILSSESSAPTLSKRMIYNTSYMSLLSEKNNGFGIESKYGQKEIVQNEGKDFEVLSIMNVPKGQIVDTKITGYVPSKTGIGGDFNYLIPVVAVVVIGAVSYPLLKNKIGRKQRRRSIRTPPVTQISEDETQEVVESNLQPDVVLGNVSVL
ncbi:MSCRAMM family protein, partial [Candidatus Methanoperedens nitratireducens]|uniref:MSCRAMM family protein n=1 Tax=Candidatus Methanoperedens nitratireducens TaxID=1392998 RepID=UPI001177736A